jgi:hypothetical protein
MIIIFIIVGAWLFLAMLMVCALVAAARCPSDHSEVASPLSMESESTDNVQMEDRFEGSESAFAA